MLDQDPFEGLLEDFLDSLRRFKPTAIPRGSIRELRGGLMCVDLATGRDIESAIILVRGNRREMEPRFLHRIDYAVRGNVRGILAGRKISYTLVEREGWIRKKLRNVEWMVPDERNGDAYHRDYNEGSYPLRGEVWDGGPHHALTDELNADELLLLKIRDLVDALSRHDPAFTVFSDVWNESIRVSGGMWARPDNFLEIYTSKTYFDIANGILGHLRDVRRRFGGLTF